LETKISNEEKSALNFVLAVLRQHEIELEGLIAKLEYLVDKINELSEKIDQIYVS